MFEWILKFFVSKLLLLYSSFAKWSTIHTGYSVYVVSGMDLNKKKKQQPILPDS